MEPSMAKKPSEKTTPNAQKFTVRTIAIPVAEVIEGGTKSEFYAALRESLGIAMRIANLSLTECRRQDDWTQEKCGKIYTYPKVSAAMSGGMSHAVSSVCRAMESTYRQSRWRVIRGLESLRSQRSQPWPLLCNVSSKMLHAEDAGEFITARIKLADKWWKVRLSGGSSHRDQVAGIRKAITSGKICDSKIWVDRKHKAILGIACQLPIAERRATFGTLRVASSRESLLVMTSERSDVPFVINADECKKWQSESNRRCQRFRQDMKTGANRKRIREEMNAVSEKYMRRMRSLLHEVASRAVEHAKRRRVAKIELDLTIKSYVDQFQWFDLAEKIKYKAADAGIEVVEATQAVVEPDLNKPHVYFALGHGKDGPRIKIGCTGKDDGSRLKLNAMLPEKLLVLAIDCQPKSKVRAREKHFHAFFKEHQIEREWFAFEPVYAWLREVKWLGNAGNLSQIMQYLDETSVSLSAGPLRANSERPSDIIADGRSQNAVKSRGYQAIAPAAHVVLDRTIEC